MSCLAPTTLITLSLFLNHQPQLGVDNQNAIHIGGLAHNPLFFGSASPETISANEGYGSWNGAASIAPHSAQSWIRYGGISNYTASGTFAFHRLTGGANNNNSHRTILLGY